MGISIHTNIPSLISQGNLNNSIKALQSVMEQLTTGLKLNKAGDDAAGLVISNSMNIQIAGSKKAMNNVQDAQNFAAVAESAIVSIGDNLQRINELILQGATDSTDIEAKKSIIVEIKQRLEDIDFVAEGTGFNGRTMLDGTFGPGKKPFIIQIGAYSDVDSAKPLNTLDISSAFTDCHTSALGTGTTIGAKTYKGIMLPDELDPDSANFDPTGDNFRKYMNTIQAAITETSQARGLLGGFLNRMQTTYDNLSYIVENLTNAKSRITDTDVASASTEFVKQQVLEQTSASMLTQANQLPALALDLL